MTCIVLPCSAASQSTCATSGALIWLGFPTDWLEAASRARLFFPC